MGSGSSTSQLVKAQTSSYSISEGRHGNSKAIKKPSDEQREPDVILLANKYEMKVEEVKLLWKRFQQLGADKSGQLDRAVFSDSDIYSDIFCKQVWGRIEEGSTKISFEKFLNNMRQYQYESNDEKLKRYFDWMSNNDDQITRDRLKTILRHATDDQDEDSAAADGKVEMVMKVMDPERKGYISCDQFLHFINSIPEDQLSPLLSFNILQHGGHHSEHSSQHTQPI